MTSLATAFVDVRPDMKKFGPEMSRSVTRSASTAGTSAGKGFSSRFGGAVKGVAASLAGVFAVSKGVDLFKSTIKEASDLNESVNAVNVTFGKNAGGIKKLGKEAADAVGLSKTEFNGLAVQFSAFAGVIAGKGGNVVGTMDKLTTRGADFASVMNLDVNEAMRLFQSGLAGETEPLRKFGIDLSAAAVEAHAYKTGIAEAGTTLTEQQKVQARYSLLMKQTAKTQGDFANTSDGLANKQRILGATMDNLQATIGARLIPVVTKIVTKVAGFVTGMQEGTGAGGKFASIMGRVGDVLGVVVGFLVRNKAAVGAFVAVLGGFMIISKITKAVAAFNIVLAANPIGIVVVAIAALAAALVIAYKRSATFRKIVDKAWAGIKKAVSSAWNGVIKPAFRAMVQWIKGTLIPIVQRLWKGVIAPAFRAIGAIIKGVWNGVIRPVLKLLVAYVRNVVIPIIKFLWNRVVGPAFRGMGNIIRGVWNNVIKPVFNALKRGVEAVRGAFRSAVSGIGKIWDSLKEKAKAPVRFVVNTVLGGMVKAMNKIPGVSIGTPSVGFATGGAVWGGRKGKDSVNAWLTPDEHVLTVKEVRGMGGHKNVERMRELARKGALRPGPGDPGLKFAAGGAIPASRIARAQTFARLQAGKPYIWGEEGPGGYDCSGFMSAITNVIRGRNPYSRVGTTSSMPWPGFVPGYGQFTIGNSKAIGHMGGTLGGMGVESTDGSVRIGGAARGAGWSGFATRHHLGSAGGGAGGGGFFDPLAKFLDAIKAIKAFAGKIKGWIGKMGDFGAWGDMLKGALRSALGGAKNWVNDKIPGPGPFPSFDRGGVATGRGSLGKSTMRPERVLSPNQTAAFDRLVATLERGGTGPMVHIQNAYTRDERQMAHRIRVEQTKALTLARQP